MKKKNKPELLDKLKNIIIKVGDLSLHVIYLNTVLSLKLPATIIIVLSYLSVICVLISDKTKLPK